MNIQTMTTEERERLAYAEGSITYERHTMWARCMKTIKVSELTGAALDWAVAKCEGVSTVEFIALQKLPDSDNFWKYCYSTDWAQGGPIIEREQMEVNFLRSEGEWYASVKGGFYEQYGDTPLIAAMRCCVASKLGDTVEVPKELAT